LAIYGQTVLTELQHPLPTLLAFVDESMTKEDDYRDCSKTDCECCLQQYTSFVHRIPFEVQRLTPLNTGKPNFFLQQGIRRRFMFFDMMNAFSYNHYDEHHKRNY